MPSKVRDYKKEYQAKIERLREKPGGLDAERDRLKHAQRKRRRDPSVQKKEREMQRKRVANPEYVSRQRKLTKDWRKRRVVGYQA